MAEGLKGDDRESLWTRILLWCAWWVAFFAIWMLLVSVLVAEEIVAGAGAAALAATVAEIVRVQDYRRFRPDPRWVIRVVRLPAPMLADCIVLARVVWRRVVRRDPISPGAFRALRFESGGDSGRAAARRAFIVAAIAITSNTVVVGIDEEEDIMLVHQLDPCPPERAREEILGRL